MKKWTVFNVNFVGLEPRGYKWHFINFRGGLKQKQMAIIWSDFELALLCEVGVAQWVSISKYLQKSAVSQTLTQG